MSLNYDPTPTGVPISLVGVFLYTIKFDDKIYYNIKADYYGKEEDTSKFTRIIYNLSLQENGFVRAPR